MSEKPSRFINRGMEEEIVRSEPSETNQTRTRARASRSYDNSVLGYTICAWFWFLTSAVAVVVGFYVFSGFALLASFAASACLELARIAERLKPPPMELSGRSVLDVANDSRLEHWKQRVALISIMSSSADPEARIRAKRELHWFDVEVLGKVDTGSEV